MSHLLFVRGERRVWIAGAIGVVVGAVGWLPPQVVAATALLGLAALALRTTQDAASSEPEGEDLVANAVRVRSIVEGVGLQMHYQPIVWMPTGEIVGYEALARFDSPP